MAARASRLSVEILTQSANAPLSLPGGERRYVRFNVNRMLHFHPHAFDGLRQARPVLKPEGRVIFLEQGRAHDPEPLLGKTG